MFHGQGWPMLGTRYECLVAAYWDVLGIGSWMFKTFYRRFISLVIMDLMDFRAQLVGFDCFLNTFFHLFVCLSLFPRKLRRFE